jgi:hypothetical protein
MAKQLPADAARIMKMKITKDWQTNLFIFVLLENFMPPS